MHVPDLNDHGDVTAGSLSLSRRAVLLTGTVAAGALAAPGGTAAQVETIDFGAPLVELVVPAGVLTLEQKAAMVEGITDVLNTALKQPADPSRRMFVEIMETAEGGFGVNGRIFSPRVK
jgi:4-oxalocrotonate tautomerase